MTTVVTRAGFWGSTTSSYSLIADYNPNDRRLRRVLRRLSMLKEKTGAMIRSGLALTNGQTIAATTHKQIAANDGGTPIEGGALGGLRTVSTLTDMASFVAGTAADVTPLDNRLAAAPAPSTYPVGVQDPWRGKSV